MTIENKESKVEPFLVGPDLEDFRTEIGKLLGQYFDARGPKPRHVLKRIEAERVVSGGDSPALNEEAKMRGVEVAQLATTIIDKSTETDLETEIQRQKAFLELDTLKSHKEIIAFAKRFDLKAFATPGRMRLI